MPSIPAQIECLETRVLLAAPNPLQLSSLLPAYGGHGTAGFAINGVAANDWSGVSVASVGDVNGDGLDDMLIGASLADPNSLNDAGASYLVFGNVEGTQSSLNLSTLNGTNGFILNGFAAGNLTGWSVGKAGDVNGDGFADLLIGASSANPNGFHSGQCYVVFGGQANLAALDIAGGGTADGIFSLSSLDGTTGFILNGATAFETAGNPVSGAGDVNGDGFSDLLIGAQNSDLNGTDSGRSYVVFGGQPNLTSLDTSGGTVADGWIDLGALNGINGFIIDGAAPDDLAGGAVSAAGDVNGDGFSDLLIGAWHKYANPGQTYLVFGGQSNLTVLDTAAGGVADGRFNLSAIDGTTGYIFNGIAGDDRSGNTVSGAGDVNGDGFADLLIGAKSADPNGSNSGQTYLVFGGLANLTALDTASGGTPDGQINLSALNGTMGFVLNGRAAGDNSSGSLSAAGDVNGDGFADLLIGAGFAATNGANAGQSYLVFGGPAKLLALDTAGGGRRMVGSACHPSTEQRDSHSTE